MKLSEFPEKAQYSLTEFRLFETLPKDGTRIRTTDIAEKRGDGWDVQFPLKNITVVMNLLISKVNANKEPFRIAKEDKTVGHPFVEYWLEPRSKYMADKEYAPLKKRIHYRDTKRPLPRRKRANGK